MRHQAVVGVTLSMSLVCAAIISSCGDTSVATTSSSAPRVISTSTTATTAPGLSRRPNARPLTPEVAATTSEPKIELTRNESEAVEACIEVFEYSFAGVRVFDFNGIRDDLINGDVTRLLVALETCRSAYDVVVSNHMPRDVVIESLLGPKPIVQLKDALLHLVMDLDRILYRYEAGWDPAAPDIIWTYSTSIDDVVESHGRVRPR